VDQQEGAEHVEHDERAGDHGGRAEQQRSAADQLHDGREHGRDARQRHTHLRERRRHPADAVGGELLPAVCDQDDTDQDAGDEQERVAGGLGQGHGGQPSVGAARAAIIH